MTVKLSIDQQNLVVSHLSLAQKLARIAKKKATFLNYDELESAAYMGLSEAAGKYDPSLKIAFETYASCRISGAIKDYLRELSWGSRNNPVKTESVETHDFAYTAKEETSACFDKIVNPLSSNNKRILRLHYVDECKIREIADDMGVHESRVSQILSESRLKLRQHWGETQSELWAEVA